MTALVTCLWRRPRLTAIFLDYWAGFGGLLRVACAADEDPEPSARHAAWHYVAYPNVALADRFNAAVGAACRLGAHRVVVVGSDNFADAAFLAAAGAAEGHAAPESLYVFDAPTRRLAHYRGAGVGAGRVFCRRLLRAAAWKPYPPGDAYVDGNADDRLRMIAKGLRRAEREEGAVGVFDPALWRRRTITGGVLLDVKGPGSKNPFSVYARHADRLAYTEAAPFLHRHFPGIAGRLLALAEQ